MLKWSKHRAHSSRSSILLDDPSYDTENYEEIVLYTSHDTKNHLDDERRIVFWNLMMDCTPFRAPSPLC